MPSFLRCVASLCLPCLASVCLAQAKPAAPPPPPHLLAPAAAAAPASAAPTAQTSPTKTVVEDDAVRIEETRLRGQAQRITVRNKLPGVKDYEILVAPGGKDASQEHGSTGKRAWSLFNF